MYQKKAFNRREQDYAMGLRRKLEEAEAMLQHLAPSRARSLALTKLDGTAKGGVIFALAKQFNIPIRFIGVGEGIDDLRDFESEPFVQALFAERERP